MINESLIYVGGVVVALWGIAHVAPSKKVVSGFGSISQENKRILTMAWLAEGLALIFIGALVLFLTAWGCAQDPASVAVYRAAGLMLVVMAALTSLTGSRTSAIFFKVCLFVKTIAAILLFAGTLL